MIHRRPFDTVDIDLRTGRILRVGVTRSGDGSADRLILLPGWRDGGGVDFRHRIDLPAAILPALLEALHELEAIDEEDGE